MIPPLTRVGRRTCAAALLISFWSSSVVAQQPLPCNSNIDFVTTAPQDFTIPTTNPPPAMRLSVKGADGGLDHLSHCSAPGGTGAVAEATFAIGNLAGQLEPGATLRFVIGQKGDDGRQPVGGGNWGAAGGGGSAVLYRRAGSTSDLDWQLLLVGGAGGGGNTDSNDNGLFVCDPRPGQDGQLSECGGDGWAHPHSGGCFGQNGTGEYANAGGGGHMDVAYAGNAQPGYPAGGTGGTHHDAHARGGWGYGGGGSPSFGAGGGGGGYSGGGAGGHATDGNGGGGGSFVSPLGSSPITFVADNTYPAHGQARVACVYSDECTTATAVPTPIWSFRGTLINNSGSTGPDSSCSGFSTIDEWFEFTAEADGPLTVTTCLPFTQFDTTLAIFDGCPENGGTEITCNLNTDGVAGCDFDGNGIFGKSTITTTVARGSKYYIRVAPQIDDILDPSIVFGDSDYNFEVAFTGPALGDNCDIAIPVGNESIVGTLSGNTGPADPVSTCDSVYSIGEWYAYTAAANGTLTVSTCGSLTNFDTLLAAFEDCAAGVYQIACNDDTADACALVDGVASSSRISFPVLDGVTYLVRISAYSGILDSDSVFELHFDGPRASGDDCNAPVYVVHGTYSGSLRGHTSSINGTSCGGGDTIDSWYRYTADADGTLTVSTCNPGTTFDTTLAVIGRCNNLSESSCNDDTLAAGCVPGTSTVSTPVIAGNTYLVRVGAKNNAFGNGDYELTFDGPVAGDLCTNPRRVSNGVHAGTLANNSASGASDCGTGNTIDEWFSYTALDDGALTVTTCGSGSQTDSVISLWFACPETGSAILCNEDLDDLCPETPEASGMAIAVQRGATYLFRLSAVNDDVGDFFLIFYGPSGGDECTEPIDVTDGAYIGTLADNSGATPDDSCNSGNAKDEWYRYTAVRNGRLDISTCNPGTEIDTMLSVWTGCPEDNGSEIVCIDNSTLTSCSLHNIALKSAVTLNGVAGETYWVRVSAYNDEVGQFEISFNGPSAYENAVRAAEPLLYWSFDEPFGLALDQMGFDGFNSLLPQGTATRTVSSLGFGNAAEFDGTVGSRFFVDTLAPGASSYAHYAIEMLVQLDDAETATYLLEAGTGSGGNSPSIINGFFPNLEFFGGGGRTGSPGPAALADGEWHHLVIEIDAMAATHTIYVDGLRVGTFAGGNAWNAQVMSIGATYIGGGGHPTDGRIDEVAFYDLSGSLTGESIALHAVHLPYDCDCGLAEECATAFAVTDGLYMASLLDNVDGVDVSSCRAGDVIDEWYTYTATEDGSLEITTCYPELGALDTVLSVFDACPLNGGQELACNDESGCTIDTPFGTMPVLSASVNLDVTAGTTYFVRVSSVPVPDGQPGTFAISFTGPGACPCEFNGTPGVDIGDLLAFLSVWFADTGNPPSGGAGTGADYNDDDAVNIQDLLAFLACWFTASTGDCS